jgi:polysaccharide biosynthesis transport protein
MKPQHSPQSSDLSLSIHQKPRPIAQPEPVSVTDPSEELWDLTWVFSVLRRKALPILGLAAATTGLAAVAIWTHATIVKPKYEGSFQLQVEAATAEAKSSQSFVRAQTTDRALEEAQGNVEQNSTLDYETQIRILRSNKLMEPIVKQIQTRYPKTTYESLLKDLKIDRIKITKDGKEQGTKLIEVGYTAADRQEVLFVLGQVSQAYLNYSLQERQSNLRQGMKFIDNQLPALRERVNKVQAQIAALRQQSKSIEPEQQGVDFSQQLSALKSQKLAAETKTAEARARYQTLQQQLTGGNAVAVLSEYPSMQKLVERYQELKTQLAVTSSRFSENNPAMQSLREEEKKLTAVFDAEADKILSRAAAQVEIAAKQQQTIAQAETALNQKIQQLPEFARKYGLLDRELKVASETLARYLSKREAVGIDAAQQQVPWETLGAPTLKSDVTGKPIDLAKSNKVILLSLAAILASLLAVAIAFLVEIWQDILYASDEVRRATKLPVLATIPVAENSKSSSAKVIPLNAIDVTPSLPPATKRLAEDSASDAFSLTPQDFSALSPRPSQTQLFKESFNSLYTNIGFADERPQVRSVAVSSCKYQQGKSKVAIYLAKAAAAAGQRVLLVDTDLRAPQIHAYLQLDNTRGLSEAIESRLDVDRAIQRSNVERNLSVLVAGQPSLPPVQLLSSPRMRGLMNKFATEFDLVIYTTPPIDYADLSWVGTQVDGVIIATRLGKIQRKVLQQSIEALRIGRIPILGIVTT